VEPVIYPTAIPPVAHPDRIQRSESRRDNGKESAFARTLRRRQEDPDARDAPEDGGSPPGAASAAEPRAGAGGTDAGPAADEQGAAGRRIDVRV
jgi:hypothetical protein